MNSALISKFKGTQVVISKSTSVDYTFDDIVQIVNVDATAADVVITLPLISANPGRVLTIRKVDASANLVTVVTGGSDLYQGGTSVDLGTQWAALQLDNDGTYWYQSGGSGGGGGGGGGLAPGTTLGQVLYCNSSLQAAGDTSFNWDPTLNRLAIGTGYTASQAVELGSTEALVTVGIRNTNVAGYAGIKFFDVNNILQMNMGVGNTGASPANYQGPYLALASGSLTFINGSNATIATLAQSGLLTVANTIWSTSGGFKFPDNTVQITAASAGGTLSGGTTNAIPYWSSSSAIGNTSASWDGSHFTFLGTTTEYSVGVRSSGSDNGGYLQSTQADELLMSGGAAYIAGAWTAKATAAGILGYGGGLMRFYTNSGLTIGNTFVPTLRAQIDNSGNMTVNGIVKSTSGGFTFPDNTTQTTAATSGVTGSGTANQLAYWSSGTALTSNKNLYWDPTTRRLLIANNPSGTPTPSHNFEVQASSGAITFYIDPNGNSNNGVVAIGSVNAISGPLFNEVLTVSNGSTAAAIAAFQKTGANWPTSYGAPGIFLGGATLNSANNLATIGFGYSSAGTFPPAEFGYLVTDTSSNTKGDFVWATRNVVTNTAPSEKMRLTSVGHVLIGSPTDSGHSALLQVAGIIESTTGGVRYPDGTIQTTASGGGTTTGVGVTNAFPYWSDTTTLSNTGIYWLSDTAAFGPTADADSGTTIVDSNALLFQYSYWDGMDPVTSPGYALKATGTDEDVLSGDLVFLDGGVTEKMRLKALTGVLLIGTPTDDTFALVQVNGIIESQTGGFRFPDGTVQSTAAGGGGSGTISGLTAGRIVYSTSATSIADDSALLWDATNNRIKVGLIAGTHPVELGSGENTQVVAIRASSATGTPSIQFYNDSNTLAAHLGVANSGASSPFVSGRSFWDLRSGGLDFINAGTTVTASISAAGAITGTQFNLNAAGTDNLVDDGSDNATWTVPSGKTITLATGSSGITDVKGTLKAGSGFAKYLSFTGSASGNATISTVGSDVTIAILPSGTGNVLVGTATDDTNALLQVNGKVESKTGGFLFPDGSTQITSAASSGVAGAIQYSNGAGGFSSDNSGIHYDSTNHRLGLGITLPLYRLDLGAALADVKLALFNNASLYAGFGFQVNQLISQLDATTSSFIFKGDPSTEVARLTGDGRLLVGVSSSTAILDIQVASTPLFEVYNSAADTRSTNAVTVIGVNTTYGSYPTLTVGTGAQAIALQSKNGTQPTIEMGDGSAGFKFNFFNFRSFQDDGTNGLALYTKTAASATAKRFSITGNATVADVIVQNANLLVNTTTDNGSGSVIQANGVIQSTSGGIKYPDGTTQTSAASGTVAGLTAGRIPYASSVSSLVDTASLYWDTTNLSLVVDSAASSLSPLIVKGSAFTDSTANGLSAGDAALATFYNNATAYNASPKSGLLFGGPYHSADLAPAYWGAIVFAKTNTTTDDAGSFFTVSTRPTGATAGTFTAERMRINAAGNMLVGTSSDNSLGTLQVAGGITATALSQISGTPTTTGILRALTQLNDTTAFGSSPEVGYSVGLYNDSTPTRFVAGGITWGKENGTSGNSASYARLITRSNSTGLTEAMRITSGQKVLIGATTDDGFALLQVNGVIESKTGGIRFPDGSIQTTSSASSSASGALGAVQYSDGAGVFSADDANFHWHTTNQHLLIGTNTDSGSGAKLQVAGVIESTSSGFRFPDGTVQTSSAATVATRKVGEYVVLQTTDTDFFIEKLPTPLIGGTVSAAPAADTSMMMLKFLSAASSGDAVGISGPYLSTRANYGPVFYATVRTDSAITNQRHFIGLSSADLSAIATLAGLNTIPMMAFRYDTGLSDTNWMAVTSDGSTASAQSTGVAVAANTTYTLKVDFSTPGTVKFTIDNASTPQVSKTSNLPGGSTNQGIEVSMTTLAASAQSLYIERVKLDQN